jgi:hypothetical protein
VVTLITLMKLKQASGRVKDLMNLGELTALAEELPPETPS